MTKSEVQAKKRYVAKGKAALESQSAPGFSERLVHLTADLEQATTILSSLAGVTGVPTIEQLIEQASAWVDRSAVNPQHTPMAEFAKPMYSISSGFAHGYTWTTHYVREPNDLFAILADLLYASTSMLGAAVVLYEAQASVSSRIGKGCPDHLRPVAARFHELYVD
ncbi:hypothetical protein [Rhodococcus sp. HNM0569]|uniref:hypothetical protein n=1 Tax=Rhodococcus sp. HNM0569 TaxID=2716340 RepID=UPI00146C1176|nr:hypothetical protein [Rhodococcus sp. HNM0569]NLU83620.1 hypothetical protein [Rhodococcus sp. HNM0569]